MRVVVSEESGGFAELGPTVGVVQWFGEAAAVDCCSHVVKCDVEISLRGGKGRVAEEFLDCSEVSAPTIGGCGPGVPERVRVGPGDPGDDFVDAHGMH